MRYQQRIIQKIGEKIKYRWSKWQNKRLLKGYYRSQNLIELRAPRFLQNVFVFFVILLLLFWYAPTLNIAFWGIIVFFVVMVWGRISKEQRESRQLKKACFQKIAVREYQKRLERTPHEVLMKILQEEISEKFEVRGLKINNGFLEGRLFGEKLVVAYLDVNREEVIAMREVQSVVKKCFQRGISQVRIFTNGDSPPAVSNLGQCYELNLRLYNAEKLQYLLKNTLLFPSVSEITEIINCEKLKRQKKMSVIKGEILKKKKVSGYLLYSLLLFLMAWLRLGVVYLNIAASLILLGFALMIIIKNFQLREKEVTSAAYFQKEGL
ncbi:MAG: hypothetical protein PHC81_01455 [Clostridia bacterium]|nr:hypothetical protein [Clostridia bacterium]